jgi:hypothetical protein
MTKARDLADRTSADLTAVTAGTGISITNGTGPIPTVTNTVATGFDAKGDLIAGTGADTFSKLTVATTNDWVLTSASSEATGLKWAQPASAPFVGASVYDANNQSVTQYVSTAITWTSEDFDTDGFHSNSTNTSRMTIPTGKGGYYQVNGTIGTTPTGGGRLELYIRKNNVNWVATRGSVTEEFTTQVSAIVDVVAGDYLELFGFTEATTPSLKKGVYGHFSIAYLGA